MRAIWSEEKPAYHGRYVSFQEVQAYPHPQQQPTPPIVIGGRAPAVLRRTVEQANGWYGFALNLDETANLLAQLREAAAHYYRPASLGKLADQRSSPRATRQGNSATFCRTRSSSTHLDPPARAWMRPPLSNG